MAAASTEFPAPLSKKNSFTQANHSTISLTPTDSASTTATTPHAPATSGDAWSCRSNDTSSKCAESENYFFGCSLVNLMHKLEEECCPVAHLESNDLSTEVDAAAFSTSIPVSCHGSSEDLAMPACGVQNMSKLLSSGIQNADFALNAASYNSGFQTSKPGSISFSRPVGDIRGLNHLNNEVLATIKKAYVRKLRSLYAGCPITASHYNDNAMDWHIGTVLQADSISDLANYAEALKHVSSDAPDSKDIEFISQQSGASELALRKLDQIKKEREKPLPSLNSNESYLSGSNITNVHLYQQEQCDTDRCVSALTSKRDTEVSSVEPIGVSNSSDVNNNSAPPFVVVSSKLMSPFSKRSSTLSDPIFEPLPTPTLNTRVVQPVDYTLASESRQIPDRNTDAGNNERCFHPLSLSKPQKLLEPSTASFQKAASRQNVPNLTYSSSNIATAVALLAKAINLPVEEVRSLVDPAERQRRLAREHRVWDDMLRPALLPPSLPDDSNNTSSCPQVSDARNTTANAAIDQQLQQRTQSATPAPVIIHHSPLPQRAMKGVSFDRSKRNWEASWLDARTGRRVKKCFSEGRWGSSARDMAIMARKEAEDSGIISMRQQSNPPPPPLSCSETSVPTSPAIVSSTSSNISATSDSSSSSTSFEQQHSVLVPPTRSSISNAGDHVAENISSTSLTTLQPLSRITATHSRLIPCPEAPPPSPVVAACSDTNKRLRQTPLSSAEQLHTRTRLVSLLLSENKHLNPPPRLIDLLDLQATAEGASKRIKVKENEGFSSDTMLLEPSDKNANNSAAPALSSLAALLRRTKTEAVTPNDALEFVQNFLKQQQLGQYAEQGHNNDNENDFCNISQEDHAETSSLTASEVLTEKILSVTSKPEMYGRNNQRQLKQPCSSTSSIPSVEEIETPTTSCSHQRDCQCQISTSSINTVTHLAPTSAPSNVSATATNNA